MELAHYSLLAGSHYGIIHIMKNQPILYYCEHTAWVNLNSGIQRVTRMLAKSLLENGVDLVPVKFNHETRKLQIISRSEMEHLAKWSGPDALSWGTDESLAEKMKAAKAVLIPEMVTYGESRVLREIIDDSHANGIKVAVVFHDAIPMRYPAWYEPENFAIYAEELKRADLVLSVSQASANDFHDLVLPKDSTFNIENLVVATLATELVGVQRLPQRSRNNKDINMLFVSNFDKRKNHELLLKAYNLAKKELSRRGIRLNLTLAGSIVFFKDYQKLLNRMAAKTGAIIKINCSDDELRELYSNSDFTVYPSLYEGFGLPVMESLYLGRPVISSTGGSLAEIAKNGCVTFEPTDIKRLALLMVILASNDDFRQKLIDDIDNVKIKTWSEYAEQVADEIYKRL